MPPEETPGDILGQRLQPEGKPEEEGLKKRQELSNFLNVLALPALFVGVPQQKVRALTDLVANELVEGEKYRVKERPEYYSEEVNEVIAKCLDFIEGRGEGIYQRLGLDSDKISRPGARFIETSMRRELSINDSLDSIQAWWSENINTLEDSSIGPFEIRPATYAAALVGEQGYISTGDYEADLKWLMKRGLVYDEDAFLRQLQDPEHAIIAFETILKMYMPEKNQPVRILVQRGDRLMSYKIPLGDSYTFSTKEGDKIVYTNDEMRLMAALAKYQGVGLRFLSPDAEVQVDEDNEEIILNQDYVLNNRVSEIATHGKHG